LLLIQIKRGNLPYLPVEPAERWDQSGWAGDQFATKGQNSMHSARVTYGFGGLVLVGLVLTAVQLALGINSMPI
jgi:hypothetical protein